MLIAGNVVLYIPGVIWLGAYTGMGRAVSLGFLPFVIGDLLKTAAGWGLLSGMALVTGRARET
jgi:biotin transport system substrate-specific component